MLIIASSEQYNFPQNNNKGMKPIKNSKQILKYTEYKTWHILALLYGNGETYFVISHSLESGLNRNGNITCLFM